MAASLAKVRLRSPSARCARRGACRAALRPWAACRYTVCRMTSPMADPYRSPSVRIVESEDITDDELRAFAGPRAEFYLSHWRVLRASGRFGSRFHVPAFLFTGIWCVYRGMYALAFGVSLACGVLLNLLALLAVGVWTKGRIDGLAVFALGHLALPALFGAFANYAYYLRATR